MKAQYYVHPRENVREGPYDLLAMMRRIKNQKITADTLISTETMDVPTQASRLSDLALFFDTGKDYDVDAVQRPKGGFFPVMLRSGWRFISNNQGMCVFAGTIVLLTFLFGIPLYNVSGLGASVMVSSMIYFTMQSIFMICTLRLNRGQHINLEFVQLVIMNNMGFLFMSSCVLAVVFWAGMLCLLLPGIVILSVYIFVPFLIADRGYSVIEAMEASRMLMRRKHSLYFIPVIGLVGLHITACLTVLLIPLTLPLMAAPIAELYDELSYKS